MHHTMKIYARYQSRFLKAYMFLARLTRIPLLGRLVRQVGNIYGRRVSGGYLLTTDEALKIVEDAGGLALGPCACRTVFANCENPVQAEIMVGLERNAFLHEKPHEYREISSQQAAEILQQCHRNGLIHTIVKCRDNFYAICNCCSCCCVPLRLNKKYGIGSALLRRNDILDLVRRNLAV